MASSGNLPGFHSANDLATITGLTRGGTLAHNHALDTVAWVNNYGYDFENFWHPFVGDLITRLNQTSVAGLLDPDFLAGLHLDYLPGEYRDPGAFDVTTTVEPGGIDVS